MQRALILSMGKAVVFIDGGYLNKVLEKVFGRPPFSYEKFSNELCARAGCERVRTYYYNCSPYQSNPPTSVERKKVADFDRFIAHLRNSARIETRLGRLQRIGNEFKQKHVDVYLSVDLVKLACKGGVIDKAIIVSGDSDFTPAVEVAKEQGVVIVLYYSRTPPMYVHYELLGVCDEKFEIRQDLIDASRP